MNANHGGRRRRQTGGSVGSFVAAAAVAYGTYRVMNWAWDSWNTRSSKDNENDDSGNHHHVVREVLVSQTPNNNDQKGKWRLRRQRIERCRQEAANAMSDFLPTLQRKLEEATDTSADSRALKQLRSSSADDDMDGRRETERELWNSIKTKALTRLVATVYSHTILFLVLTVQVHLMGGKLFEEQAHAPNSDAASSIGNNSVGRMVSYQESHRIVLSKTYEFFFDEGIRLLVQAVERAVETIVGDWDVTQPSSVHTTRDMLDAAIRDICAALLRPSAGRTSSRNRPRSLLRFLLPPEQGLDSVVSDGLAQSILDETLDVLESPVFEDAQRDALSNTLDMMRDKSWSNIFIEQNLPQHAATPWGTKPLATVVSKLKTTSRTFFITGSSSGDLILQQSNQTVNMYVSSIERLPSVLELGDVSFN